MVARAQRVEVPDALKQGVRDFWEAGSCGEVYARGASRRESLEAQARARYALEPYLRDFARFADGAGRDVLEVGVGMGADHLEWARSCPRSLSGVDLTPRAVDHTRARLEAYGYVSRLFVGDAEKLPFPDDGFDLVYSWGVLHHTPDTARAVQEVHRVLRPGGTARIMIYHARSVVGAILWLRYGLLAGRPTRSLAEVYARHLESPGTKAYTVAEARRMFAGFASADLSVQLSLGDLLQGAVGQQHGGLLLAAAKAVWPRWLVRRACRRWGLCLLIEAVK